MPITTYIRRSLLNRINKSVKDKDLLDLMTEVRKIDDKLYLQELKIEKRRVFRANFEEKAYRLYNSISNFEAQIINFGSDVVEKDIVANSNSKCNTAFK